jgi:acetolactate synthase-1/2/3 large subunit
MEKLLEVYGYKVNVIRNNDQLDQAIADNLSYSGASASIVFIDPETRMNPIVQSKMVGNGRIVSLPIEELAPDLPESEFKENMIIERYQSWDS